MARSSWTRFAACGDAGPDSVTRLALAVDARAFPDDRCHDERDGLGDAAPPPVELDWDDPWVLCYTGGTTGLPKGAILTHGNITWNAINTVVSWGLTPDDVTVLNMPLFHTGGLNVFTAPLVHDRRHVDRLPEVRAGPGF